MLGGLHVLLDGRTAKALGLVKTRRSATVARGQAPLAGTLTLRFTRSARRRLAPLTRLKLTLTVVAVDGQGNRATLRRRVTLTRRSVTLGAATAAAAHRIAAWPDRVSRPRPRERLVASNFQGWPRPLRSRSGS